MSDSNQTPPSTCRACASAEIFGPVRLFPETGMGEGSVRVATMRSRNFLRPKAVPITAWACRRCGHLDLFTTDPETLFEFWSAEHEGAVST